MAAPTCWMTSGVRSISSSMTARTELPSPQSLAVCSKCERRISRHL